MPGREKIAADSRRAICASKVEAALTCLEGRWKMLILAYLSEGEVLRFSDLQRAIPGVSQKMLVQQLRGLETDNVVVRQVHPEVPPRVEYSLTPVGLLLRPVFLALVDWAEARNDWATKSYIDAAPKESPG